MHTAPIAVIGGSGLSALFDGPVDVREIATPYGDVEVARGSFGGRDCAFLPRHGRGHTVAPHLIDYRANIWAVASLGACAVLSSSAVGSLHPRYAPGDLVLTDQIIDRTTGRAATFFDRGDVQHLAAAEPFDPELHRIAAAALRSAGETFHESATAVVIDGPRFATRAESRWHSAMGGHIVNMTMAPEVFLVAELGMGAVNLAFVTDTDAGADDGSSSDAADQGAILRRLAEAQPRIVAALETVACAIPDGYRAASSIPGDAIARVLERRA